MRKHLAVHVLVLGLLACWAGLAGADDKKDDANATGTWKSSFTTQGGQTIETTFKLKQDGDKLTGTVIGRDNKEVALENGKAKDGEVSFDVQREREGQKFTLHYKGKVSGDTITGKMEFERDGQTRGFDWTAKRQKAEK